MKKLLWLSMATFLILVSSFTIIGTANAQDDLKVEGLQIDPRSAKEGEIVTITADVINTSTTDNNTYTIELKINDEVADSESVTLEPEESKTVSFTVTAGEPGDYIVDLHGANDYFTVKTSFFAMFPTYLWALIIAIVVVLIIFIVVLVALPSRKKQARSGQKARGPSMPTQQMPQPGAQTPIPGPGPSVGPGPGQGPMAGQGRMGQPMQGPPMQGPPQGPSMQGPLQAPPMQGPPTRPPMAQQQSQMPYPQPGQMAQRPPQASKPMIQLRNLAITPNQVKQGQHVTISAIVSNNGVEHGRYSVVLRIGGLVEGISEVELAPGTSQSVAFNVLKEEPGTYYVELDGLSGSFLVIALVPAYFTVGNLTITPDRVKQGEIIAVSATVTNTGEISGTHSLTLNIKGAVESIEEVNLGPGESQRVTFNIAKEAPGFYQVELAGLSGRFVVEMEWQG